MVQMEMPNRLADQLEEMADAADVKRHAIVRRAVAMYAALQPALTAGGGQITVLLPDGATQLLIDQK